MKFKCLLISLLLVVLTVIAGCGGNTEKSPEQKSAAENPVVTGNQAVEPDSAKDNLLVDVSWLKNNINNVIVLDARTDKEYAAGHISGAINTMWQGFANMTGNPGDKGWGTLLPKDKLAEKIGALGINGDKMIVVYADPNGWGEDGRIVWMLRMAGVANSKMLDGGLPAWKAENGETSKDMPKVNPVEFKISSLDQNMNSSTDWITSNQNNIKIVDSRAEKEYQGATDFGEKRGGHLPNAINIPFKEVFNDDGKVKSTEELKVLFTKAGLKPEDEIAAYCTKGIRSAHMTLLLRIAGFEKARNYDASFYEWAGNDTLPLAK